MVYCRVLIVCMYIHMPSHLHSVVTKRRSQKCSPPTSPSWTHPPWRQSTTPSWLLPEKPTLLHHPHNTTSCSGSRDNRRRERRRRKRRRRRRGGRKRRGDWTQHWLLQGEGPVATECVRVCECGGSVWEYSWSHDILVALMTCMHAWLTSQSDSSGSWNVL